MRRVLFILIVLIILILGGALIAPALIPADVLRERTQTAAQDALGRDVSLTGDIRLSLLPRAQITAGQASIANAPGFGDQAFAEMSQLRVTIGLLPLLSRQIEVQEFVLVEPTIRLQSRNGVNNWTFETANPQARPAAEPGEGFVRRPGALPFEASFGDVRIENGSVLYSDGTQTRRIEALNLGVSLPSVDQPISLEGSFSADGRVMRFQGELGSLRGFFEGVETPFTLLLDGPLAELTANGRFLESSDLSFDGRVDMTLPLRALSRYLGTNLPDGDVFRRFSARSDIAGSPGALTLNNARVQFDDISANGALTLNYSAERPLITGQLNTERFDLTPYIPADSAPNAGSGSQGVASWSEEPIDVAALRAIDANLSITAEQLIARDIEISDVSAQVTLDRGRMVARLNQFQLYGGTGQAVAVVNARNQTPSFSFNASLETLQAQPFLNAAAGFDTLIGIGGFNLDVRAAGASPAAIMQSLSGNGGFQFADGAIKGVNIAQMIRTVQSALETGSLPAAFSETQQTDFSSLTGGFTIENGVVNNRDLLMLSPLLRVGGTGEINLPGQSIDYRITPRAVQSLAGQGGSVDLQGLDVPVRLSGDFNNVSASIDFEAVAASLLRREAGRLIGIEPNEEGETPTQPEDVVRGLIGQLFNTSRDEDENGADPGEEEENGGPN